MILVFIYMVLHKHWSVTEFVRVNNIRNLEFLLIKRNLNLLHKITVIDFWNNFDTIQLLDYSPCLMQSQINGKGYHKETRGNNNEHRTSI